MSQNLDKLREAVENDPQNPNLRLELGKALAGGSLNDAKEAISHLQQATRNPHIREEVLTVMRQVSSKLGLDDMGPPTTPPFMN
ncbi:MAG: tetratricopeptide repeat protein [Roseibacillus sp.]